MIYTSSSYIYSVPIIVIIIVIGVVVAAAFGLFSSYITYTQCDCYLFMSSKRCSGCEYMTIERVRMVPK